MSLAPIPVPTPEEAAYMNGLQIFYMRLYRPLGGAQTCSYFWLSREKTARGGARHYGWVHVDEYGRTVFARHVLDGVDTEGAVPPLLARFLVFRDPRSGFACARPHHCDCDPYCVGAV